MTIEQPPISHSDSLARPKRAPAIRQRKSRKRTGGLPIVPDGQKVPGLYYPVPQITPEDFFRELGRARKAVAAEVERLIEFLDRTDNCPDLEETDDAEGDAADEEPSLGSVDNFQDQTKWAAGGNNAKFDVDRESEHDGSEPSEDSEPSLGSFDRMMDQTKSTRQGASKWGFYTDAELE